MRSVKRVETSMSRGKTDDSAGISKTSSKVNPTGKTSCSNIVHLRTNLKKNPDLRLGFAPSLSIQCKHKILYQEMFGAAITRRLRRHPPYDSNEWRSCHS